MDEYVGYNGNNSCDTNVAYLKTLTKCFDTQITLIHINRKNIDLRIFFKFAAFVIMILRLICMLKLCGI